MFSEGSLTAGTGCQVSDTPESRNLTFIYTSHSLSILTLMPTETHQNYTLVYLAQPRDEFLCPSQFPAWLLKRSLGTSCNLALLQIVISILRTIRYPLLSCFLMVYRAEFSVSLICSGSWLRVRELVCWEGSEWVRAERTRREGARTL